MTTSKRDTAYLRSVFKMNPINDSKKLLAYRKAYLLADGSAPVIADEGTAAERLELTSQRVDALRNQFWNFDRDELNRRLDELNVDEFPELAVAVDCMKGVAERWESFQKLASHPHCFPEFLDAFRAIAIAPPGKVVQMRHSALTDAREGSWRRSSREIRRAARLVQQKFPALAALERDWLAQMTQKHRRPTQPQVQSPIVAGGLKLLMVILFMSVMRAVMSLL
ncbi:MAG: hypothetical protein O3A29_07550 [Planctomycetota bacterium]|nr:hypothetical protein [Planctomycetota bacterium]